MSLRRFCGLLLSAVLLPAAAAESVPSAAKTGAGLVPTEVVDAFHAALASGNRKGVIQQLASDLVIYEQGFVERGRDAYAEGSMPNDITFASLVKRQVLQRDAWEDGNVAWVLTLSSVTGDFGDQKLSLVNTETLVLRRTGQGWKIVHIHRSAHPRGEDEALPEPLPTAASSAPAPVAAPTPAPVPPPAVPVGAPVEAPAPPPAPESAPAAPTRPEGE